MKQTQGTLPERLLKILLAFTCSRKYIDGCMMFQVDLLFPTGVIILKKYLLF